MLYPTLRHFGPKDPTPLAFLKQAGAEGIVTALHHIAVGEVWPVSEIEKCQEEIAEAGMQWTVVESLPVSEDIKTRSGNFEKHLDNYRQSLKNLAECGITTVTYNFMPVMDWTRTDLDFRLPSGASAIRFDRVEMAVFDCFILDREGAQLDYPAAIVEKARTAFSTMSQATKDRIVHNLIKGLPGAEESFTLEEFKQALAAYDDIDADQLRAHLVSFLQAICPLAEELGVKMVIHPDDPPFPLLGLPRVLSTAEDFRYLIDQVPSESNGLCFCTGSFGVRADNQLSLMVEEFADRIHFIHLRSTQRDEFGSFHEAGHLEGDVPMRDVMINLLEENAHRETPIPMRPDHGHCMMHELNALGDTAPGYTIIGRMKGLAELTGLQMGLIWE
ncbi:MAG: mannonate dehydratase [Bacteroidota bacterium]